MAPDLRPAKSAPDDPTALAAAIGSHPQGSTLNLIVTPRSGVTVFAGFDVGALRLRVAAPPVDGAANAAVVKFLAEVVDVPKSSVRLLAGESGRRKRVLIEGLTPEALSERLRRASSS